MDYQKKSRLNKNKFEIFKNVATWQHIIVVNVEKINHMLIANKNTYTISQKMIMYFVNFNFPSKYHIIFNYNEIQLVQHN